MARWLELCIEQFWSARAAARNQVRAPRCRVHFALSFAWPHHGAHGGHGAAAAEAPVYTAVHRSTVAVWLMLNFENSGTISIHLVPQMGGNG